eukprot:sb/3464992/
MIAYKLREVRFCWLNDELFERCIPCSNSNLEFHILYGFELECERESERESERERKLQIIEMNGCMGLQFCGSSEVSDVTDLASHSERFNLFHSFYRLKWNPGKSLLESYKCGSSKFHVLHGYELGAIGTSVLSVPDDGESERVRQIIEMNGCMGLQFCGSSEVSDVTDLASHSERFSLFHSFYRLKWNPGKSLLESYKCGSSKFHVLHGYELGAIGTSVLSVPDDVSSSQVEDFVRAAFRPDITDQISLELFTLTIDSDKHITRTVDVVHEVLKQQKPILSPCQIFDMYIAPSNPLEADIPEGYFTGSLTLEHVPLIANTWSNDMNGMPASDIHRSFIESYISGRQSLGVFHKELVAWCTLYHRGAIGTLHVTKQHRGRKLGRMMLRTMARRVYEAHGIGTYAECQATQKWDQLFLQFYKSS